MENSGNSFVGFEYLEIPARRSMESMYVDGIAILAGSLRVPQPVRKSAAL